MGHDNWKARLRDPAQDKAAGLLLFSSSYSNSLLKPYPRSFSTAAAAAMRAITGAVICAEPCTLTEAHDMLSVFCSSHDSDLASSDSATYIVALDVAIKEHHKFLRRCGGHVQQQQGAAVHDYAHRYAAAMMEVERERQKNSGGPQGIAVDAGKRKSKKINKEEEPHDDDDKAKANGAGVHSHVHGEILFKQRKKNKNERHSSKELVGVVKQEPDLVMEDGGSKQKKKKKKHSSKEFVGVVKQETDLVVEGDSNGIKEEEEKMAGDSDMNSRKKKKNKRGRGDDDGDDAEQGEHKKKKPKKESRE